MGTQIHIKVQDLLEAGWSLYITESESYDWDDENQVEVPYTERYLTIEKDCYVFHSYFTDMFVADCNDWGANKELFILAGLLNIPHILS